MLTKDQILKSTIPTEKVKVPEWGGEVYVRGMTGRERDEFEQAKADSPTVANFRARLLVNCIVDESGHRLFTDADVEAVGNLSGAALGKLTDVAWRLSGYTAKEVKTLEKNSVTGPSEDSTLS